MEIDYCRLTPQKAAYLAKNAEKPLFFTKFILSFCDYLIIYK